MLNSVVIEQMQRSAEHLQKVCESLSCSHDELLKKARGESDMTLKELYVVAQALKIPASALLDGVSLVEMKVYTTLKQYPPSHLEDIAKILRITRANETTAPAPMVALSPTT